VGAPFTSETNDSFTQALCIYDPQQTQVRILDINAFRERPRYEDVQKVAQLKTEGWKAEAVVDKIVVYKPREKQSNPKTAEPAA
jgi:hypothetical protein